MSDDVKADGGEGPDLKSTDFEKYAAANGIALPCPVCGNTHLGFNTESNGRSFALLAIDRQEPSIFGANIAWLVVVFCHKCGNVRLFLRQHILDWLKKNG